MNPIEELQAVVAKFEALANEVREHAEKFIAELREDRKEREEKAKQIA